MSDSTEENETTIISTLSKMLERVLSQGKPEEPTPQEKKNFTFYLNLPDEEILKTSVTVEDIMTVEYAMAQALLIFKGILEERGLVLDPSIDNFTPRLAKKGGKPKTDMPSIDLKQKFGEIKVSSSSIQIKNEKALSVEVRCKANSHDTISSEIDFKTGRRPEIVEEENYAKIEKNRTCMFFSFC